MPPFPIGLHGVVLTSAKGLLYFYPYRHSDSAAAFKESRFGQSRNRTTVGYYRTYELYHSLWQVQFQYKHRTSDLILHNVSYIHIATNARYSYYWLKSLCRSGNIVGVTVLNSWNSSAHCCRPNGCNSQSWWQKLDCSIVRGGNNNDVKARNVSDNLNLVSCASLNARLYNRETNYHSVRSCQIESGKMKFN
jgi:hypothetical protein